MVHTMKFLIKKPSPFPIFIPLVPNTRLRTLFSNTLRLRSSLNVGDHVSQSYSTPGNILILLLCDPKDVIWMEGTPFQAMPGRVVFIDRLLSEVFRGFPQL